MRTTADDPHDSYGADFNDDGGSDGSCNTSEYSCYFRFSFNMYLCPLYGAVTGVHRYFTRLQMTETLYLIQKWLMEQVKHAEIGIPVG